MALSNDDICLAAQRLHRAEQSRQQIRQLSLDHPGITIAYVLEGEIRTGRFREDLYYRLNVVNVWLPPLRERGDDVLIIAKALLSKYADSMASWRSGPPTLSVTA